MSRAFLLCVIELSGVAITAIAILCLVGHLAGWESLLSWGYAKPIALPATVMFLLLGPTHFLIGRLLHAPAPAPPQGPPRPASFNPIDLIAALVVAGCFVSIALGHSADVLAVLIVVVGYYFGRVTQVGQKPAPNGKEGTP